MKKMFTILQIVVFLSISVVAVTVIISFPNPPSFIRHIVNNYRVQLNEGKIPTGKLDRRFLKWFNRDPERYVPDEPRIIVSPADGFIETILHKNKYMHIVIEMRYTDVHVQRVPITGKVISIEGGGEVLKKGINIMDYELKKMMPFQKITTFETEIGIVKVRQITSFFAKRISVFLHEQKTYSIGERLGNVLAGSTIVLEIPDKVTLIVKKDDEVIAGETIVARY